MYKINDTIKEKVKIQPSIIMESHLQMVVSSIFIQRPRLVFSIIIAFSNRSVIIDTAVKSLCTTEAIDIHPSSNFFQHCFDVER